MKRRIYAISIIILLALSLAATVSASAVIDDRDRRPHPTTTTRPPTTTTTRPPTTTTTRPVTTTTTRPPTTTTTRPPATTTTLPPTTTTLPPTTTTQPPTTTTTGPLPTPTGDRYDFFVNVQPFGTTWTAPYFRNLPFTPNTGWADGNRDGYKCAYGILLWNDAPAGRVTFSRVPGAADYTLIIDRFMPENGPTNRRYDTGLLGSESDPPDIVRQGECPPPTEAYESSTLPGQLPVIDYLGPQGQLLERRDYRTVSADGRGAPIDPRLKFRLGSVSSETVAVIAYWENNPYTVVYYSAPPEWGAGVTMAGYIP